MSKTTLEQLEEGALFQFSSMDPIELKNGDKTHPDTNVFRLGSVWHQSVELFNTDTSVQHRATLETLDREVIVVPQNDAK